jgi:hypothetical protein
MRFGVLVFALLAGFARRGLGFWTLRWHPRFVSVLQASPFWVLDFALASAIR